MKCLALFMLCKQPAAVSEYDLISQKAHSVIRNRHTVDRSKYVIHSAIKGVAPGASWYSQIILSSKKQTSKSSSP